MNNIEELREHCEEMMAISPMRYAYIPASSIITLIDRIEKAEKESKQWYSVVEAAISDDAEWRKQSNTASEAIGYLTTGIVMLKERAEKAEAELSAANEKLAWIKCSDGLPEANTPVQVSNGLWVGQGEYDDDEHLQEDERWQDEHHEFINLLSAYPVTHWKPLPPLPQTDGFKVEGNADAE